MATAKVQKEQSAVATKQINPEMPDFSTMTISERMAWIEEFKQKTIKASEQEFEEAVNYCVKTTKALGRSVFDVMTAVYKLMDFEEQKQFIDKFAEVNGLQKKRTQDSTRARAPRSDKGVPPVPKYKGPNGELWSGRGLPPKWLKPLLAQGKKKEDFLIQ